MCTIQIKIKSDFFLPVALTKNPYLLYKQNNKRSSQYIQSTAKRSYSKRRKYSFKFQSFVSPDNKSIKVCNLENNEI
ncbi:unnamed protein product [Paramecium sonneborni]|uniref:Uncharacterized protein n=1 Tax=Paramecium sonneborni TaxID=65129 RepID=A0A8S1L5J6_9CILI|nr:unnamed protein product [Paramecium sonneborni]